MEPKTQRLFFFIAITKIWVSTWIYIVLLLFGGDVELNPGPKQSSINAFSVCYWNLNSISAHNYAKIFFLKAYIAIHKFDIICISETYLDSNTSLDDNTWKFPVISWYDLIILQTINAEVFVSIINVFLPLRILDVLYLHECINF